MTLTTLTTIALILGALANADSVSSTIRRVVSFIRGSAKRRRDRRVLAALQAELDARQAEWSDLEF